MLSKIHEGDSRPVVTPAADLPGGHRTEVAMRSSPVDIARGVYGHSLMYGAGRRTTVGAVTNGLIWPDGDLYVPAAIGVQPSFVSTSTSDDAVGTGLQTLLVHYLDAALAQKTEVVTLDGTTPVLMAATNVRFIQCVHAYTWGTDKKAAGIITASFSGNTMSQIALGDIRCRSSARMVPAGRNLYITGLAAGVISGAASADTLVEISASEIDGWQNPAGWPLFPYAEVAVSDNSQAMSLPFPVGPFRPGTVVGMTFTVNKASTVTGTWFGFTELQGE